MAFRRGYTENSVGHTLAQNKNPAWARIPFLVSIGVLPYRATYEKQSITSCYEVRYLYPVDPIVPEIFVIREIKRLHTLSRNHPETLLIQLRLHLI